MKHLFTFRQRPNESLTGKLARVSSNTRSRVSSDTLSQVSNECRMTLDRPSTYTLSHSSLHQQAAMLPNNAACGNNKRLCRSTIPSFKKVASLLLLLALSFGFSQQAWADDSRTITGASVCYYTYGASDSWWDVSSTAKDLGMVTDFYLKGFWLNVKGNAHQNSKIHYQVDNKSASDWNIENPDNWNNDPKHFQTTGMNINILNNLQTGDHDLSIWFDNDGQYYSNNGNNYHIKFSNWGAVPSGLKIDGNWNGHNWGNCVTLSKSNNTFSTTISPNSTNEFECCFKNSNCDNAALVKPNMSMVEIESGDNCTVTDGGDSNHNFKVNPKYKTNINVQVTYDDTNKKIKVKFSQAEPVKYTVYLKLNDTWKNDATSFVIWDGTEDVTMEKTSDCGDIYYVGKVTTYQNLYFKAMKSNEKKHEFQITLTSTNNMCQVTGDTQGTAVAYSPSYSVSFNNGGHGTAPANTCGDASYTLPAALSATGYDFTGWNDGTTTYNAGASYAVTKAVTFTAQWAAKTYTITLDKNNGSADGTASINYDATAVSSVTHVTRTGYNLSGYFTTASNGTKVLNADGSFAGTNVSGYITNGKWSKAEDCKLYAQWTAKTTTITFNANGGTAGSETQVTATYGQAMPDLDDDYLPTHATQDFDGFWDATTGGKQYYNDLLESVATWDKEDATKKLYAHWKAKTVFNVTVNKKWGDHESEYVETIQAGSITPVGVTGTKPYPGFVFDHWDASPDGVVTFGNDKSESTTIRTTAAATITAVYKTPTLSLGDPQTSYGYEDITFTPNVNSTFSGTVYVCYAVTAKPDGATVNFNTANVMSADKMGDYTIVATLHENESCSSTVFATCTTTVTYQHRYQLNVNGETILFTYDKGATSASIDKQYSNLTPGGTYSYFCTDLKTGENIISGLDRNFRYIIPGTFTFTLSGIGTDELDLTVTKPAAYVIQVNKDEHINTLVKPSYSTIFTEPNVSHEIEVSDIATGYHFVNWTGPSNVTFGDAESTSTTVSVSGPGSDVTVYIQANAAVNTWNVTAVADPIAGGEVTGSKEGVSQIAGCTVTATPKIGYYFNGWTSTNGTFTDASALSTTFYPTAEGATATANFVAYTTTVATDKSTYNAGEIVTVTPTLDSHYPSTYTLCYELWLNGEKVATQPDFDINATTGVATFAAPTTAGSYTVKAFIHEGSSCTGTTLDEKTTPAFTINAEVTSALSTAVNEIGTSAGQKAPTKSVNAIGMVTSATITAEAAKAGYTFEGWTLNNCTRTDGGADKALTITVKGLGNTNPATVTANYAEDLSSGIYLQSQVITGSWTNNPNYEFKKRAGMSTSNDVYLDLEIDQMDKFGESAEFILMNSKTSTKIAAGNSNNFWFVNAYAKSCSQLYEANDVKNMIFFSTVPGTYTFHYNLSTRAFDITYPDQYSIQICDAQNQWTAHNFVNNAVNINLAAETSIRFRVVYQGAYYGNGGTMTNVNCTGWTMENNSSTRKECWINTKKAGSYTFSFDPATKKLSITYPEETYQTVTVYKDGVTPEEVKVYEVSKPSITAQVPEGMNFNGWVCTGGAAVENSSSTTTTVTNAGTNGTVKATFNTNQYIYFKDGVYDKFGNVWVTFRKSDYWDDKNGSGNNELSYAALGMTKINNTDINYFHIDDTHKDWEEVTNGIVQFTNSGTIQQNFYYTKVAYPHHNNSKSCYRACLPLFVPRDWITTNINSSQYYNDGIWMKYNSTESGFRIKGSWDSWTSDEHKFVAETPGGYEFKTTLHLDAGTTYDFKIYDDDSRTYSIKGVMTATSCTNWYMYMDQDNCQITASETGDYTFILNLGSGEVIVSVEYPLSKDDYRVVAKDDSDSKPKWEGDFIKYSSVAKKDTTSFYNNNYTFQLQQYNGSVWSDVAGQYIESATLPDTVRTQSVINFIVTQNGSGGATLAYEGVYKGNFYIRTDGVDGGWGAYETNADNVMSNYGSMLNAGSTYDNFQFDYYKAKWINSGKNVKFRIANDYSKAISDEFKTDEIIDDKETLPQDANVRFMWNSKTNQLSRAYISGSTNSADRFLVLTGDEKIYDTNGDHFPEGGTDREGLLANETSFGDNGNWVYQVDIKANPSARAKLTAAYNKQVQYFKGSEGDFTDATTEEIIGGTYYPDTKYLIRTVYDFKTNRLVTAWLPENTDIPIVDVKPVNADIMLIRHAQEAAQAITFANGGALTNVKTIYGAIELRKDSMVGRLDKWTPYTYSVCNYYVSFPFDVKVSEIFGIGSYGTNWQMQYYDGVKRAQIGWFAETSTFWTTLPGDATLKAHEGYLLQLNKNVFNKTDGDIWRNTKEHSKVYIYFPSAEPVGGLSQQEVTVGIPEHICGIDRIFTQDADKPEDQRRNHKITDTNWNVLGLPIFQNEDGKISEILKTDGNPKYLYMWCIEDSAKISKEADDRANTLEIVAADGDFLFKAMHGYMVQYAGEITWTGSAITPTEIAARRLGNDNKNYKIELQVLNNNYARVSRTYIELDENANDGFQLNEDVYMMANSTDAGIYSFAGGYDVAANVLSINNHTIPLGIEVKKAGIYTIRMPRQFDGIATLIDHDDNTETILNAYDYEAYLNKGTCEGRFELKLEVIRTTPTGINDKQQDNPLFKFIRNDQMYILRNGRLYNANGAVLSK